VVNLDKNYVNASADSKGKSTSHMLFSFGPVQLSEVFVVGRFTFTTPSYLWKSSKHSIPLSRSNGKRRNVGQNA
jgi:hypothetical protein